MTPPQTGQTRIAVVEDEHSLRADLLDFLGWRGFDAQGFDSAEAFAVGHNQQSFDLVLLDVGLPGCSGLELARQLRAAPQVPGIVMLTAFALDENRVAGLTQGADAYLTKDASLQLVEATCRSVLRHMGPRLARLSADEWVLYVTRWQLSVCGGAPLNLTHQETLLLHRLMQQPGAAVSRTDLLQDLGKPETLSNLRNLDNGASRLRRKVLAGCARELPLRPSYGLGYIFAGTGRVELA